VTLGFCVSPNCGAAGGGQGGRKWEGSERRQNIHLRRRGLRKRHAVADAFGVVPEAGPGTHADKFTVVRSPDPLGAVAAAPEFVAVVFTVFGVTGVDGQHRNSHFSGIFRLLRNSVKTRMATVQNAVQKSP
jgi:hypothetical protein